MRILVVDDDQDILDVLNSFLKSLGHSVETTIDPEYALRQVMTEIFDLAMVDLGLGDAVDGVDVMRKMKQADPKLPVAIITGYKEADRVIQAFRNGAIDCLLKPFNFDYIHHNVLDYLQERKK